MDHAIGCLIGGYIGDAAGATLEFTQNITMTSVQHAMSMPGGGALSVAPGQVTDDSEMDLALLHELISNTHEFPLQRVARAYIAWHRSDPFDIGMTCGRALAFAQEASDCFQNARTYSLTSEANGALMRCAPIAVWGVGKSDDVVADAARLDAALTHPSGRCQDCNAVYVVTIKHLLEHPGDTAGALKKASGMLETADTEVRHWFATTDPPPAHHNIGHVRHAFTLFAQYLRKGTGVSFEDALKETLLLGGDTDTNAKIVGNLMGAMHGLSALPSSMVSKVMAFDPSTHDPSRTLIGHRRPKLYSVGHGIRRLQSCQLTNATNS